MSRQVPEIEFMMKPSHLVLSVIAIISAAGSCGAEEHSAVGRAFFDANCVDCHGKDTQKGRFRADTLGGQFNTPESALLWSRVIARLEAGEMPPPGNPRPPAAEIQKLLLSAKQHLAEAARETRSGGRVRIRRLNRLEYENTVRDLLQIDTALQDLLPEDDLADGVNFRLRLWFVDPRTPLTRYSRRTPNPEPRVFRCFLRANPGGVPTSFFGFRDQIRSYRIAFDVPHDGQQMLVILDGKRYERALVARIPDGGRIQQRF